MISMSSQRLPLSSFVKSIFSVIYRIECERKLRRTRLVCRILNRFIHLQHDVPFLNCLIHRARYVIIVIGTSQYRIWVESHSEL